MDIFLRMYTYKCVHIFIWVLVAFSDVLFPMLHEYRCQCHLYPWLWWVLKRSRTLATEDRLSPQPSWLRTFIFVRKYFKAEEEDSIFTLPNEVGGGGGNILRKQPTSIVSHVM